MTDRLRAPVTGVNPAPGDPCPGLVPRATTAAAAVIRPRTSLADLMTIANGVCGFLGMAVAAGLVFTSTLPARHGLSHRTLVTCLLLYGIGMICDTLDGPVARHFGSSGLGPALDTICDAISFGFLPGVLLIGVTHGSSVQLAVVAGACVYVGAVILRLARHTTMRAAAPAGADPAAAWGRFNGMPSPVGGNCILALVVLAPSAGVSAVAAVLVALLLVADLPYPDNSSWRGAFVAGLLIASFAGIAGLIPLEVPATIALVGLVPVALVGVSRKLLDGV